MLFGESPSRLVVEITPENLERVAAVFGEQPFVQLGRAAGEHSNLKVNLGAEVLIDEPLDELKSLWKNGLAHYY